MFKFLAKIRAEIIKNVMLHSKQLTLLYHFVGNTLEIGANVVLCFVWRSCDGRMYQMAWSSGVTKFLSHIWPSTFSWVSLKACRCVGRSISNETLHRKWKVSGSYRCLIDWLIDWLIDCYPSHFKVLSLQLRMRPRKTS